MKDIVMVTVLMLIMPFSYHSQGSDLPDAGLNGKTANIADCLTRTNGLSLSNSDSNKVRTLIADTNPLFEENCRKLSLEKFDSSVVVSKENWFEKIWVKSDFISDFRLPSKIGCDQFVWTLKESKYRRASFDLVIVCEYPIADYAHPRLDNGSWAFGPQISFPWGKKGKRNEK